jgi:hypothetical protein
MTSIGNKMISEPISTALNALVANICAECWPDGFDLSTTDAPNTFKGLKQEYERRGRITVFSGNSDNSIFADVTINQMARAWHDWAHIQANADFSLRGEELACDLQCTQISSRFNATEAEGLIRILRADVIGQAQYYEKHRKYVRRQKDFVVEYLTDPMAAIESNFD